VLGKLLSRAGCNSGFLVDRPVETALKRRGPRKTRPEPITPPWQVYVVSPLHCRHAERPDRGARGWVRIRSAHSWAPRGRINGRNDVALRASRGGDPRGTLSCGLIGFATRTSSSVLLGRRPSGLRGSELTVRNAVAPRSRARPLDERSAERARKDAMIAFQIASPRHANRMASRSSAAARRSSRLFSARRAARRSRWPSCPASPARRLIEPRRSSSQYQRSGERRGCVPRRSTSATARKKRSRGPSSGGLISGKKSRVSLIALNASGSSGEPRVVPWLRMIAPIDRQCSLARIVAAALARRARLMARPASEADVAPIGEQLPVVPVREASVVDLTPTHRSL